MKKLIVLVFAMICVLGLAGCGTRSMNYIIENKPSVTGIVKEVHDNHIIVYSETADGSEKPAKDNESNFGTGYGYQHGATEGTIEVYMNDTWRIFATEEVREQIQFPTSEETIIYNGKEYLKSELCDTTLKWLELSEHEKTASSYMPPEFMAFEETWGITFTAENITPTGITIKCTQSDGEPTGELQTGSWYILENWTQKDGWKEMPYIIDGEIGWTSEAWSIPMNTTCEWEINWEWLYGAVPDGKYRIGKEVMDFRSTGNYDNSIYFVEFSIGREETISFHDKTFDKSDLSAETIEWLEFYNSLSEEEQLAINYIPADLYELCEYPTAKVMDAASE